MMNKLVVATTNENKVAEIKRMLEGMPYEVCSLKDLGIDIDTEETGTTFEENAVIKARAVYAITKSFVMADDSGLEVDYLGKAPGIYSSRYMGVDTPYDIKNQHIIDELKGVAKKDRTARFVCAMALITPDGKEYVRTGTMEGFVAETIKGENGFGYDPILWLDEYGKTSAELTMDEKNKISHRGTALGLVKEILELRGE